MQIKSIGIDLGKTTFHLVALGNRGQVVVRKKFSRQQCCGTRPICPSVLGEDISSSVKVWAMATDALCKGLGLCLVLLTGDLSTEGHDAREIRSEERRGHADRRGELAEQSRAVRRRWPRACSKVKQVVNNLQRMVTPW